MENLQLTLLAHSPVCSYERLAEACDVSKEVVRGWAQNNHIPTAKIGKHRVVNLVKFRENLLKQA